MTTRREFLNRTLLGGVAFGAGALGGWMPFRAGQLSPWSMAARVPAGGEPDLEALARRLGLDVSRGEWMPLADGGSDLALLHEGRLLDPAEWPAEALALRGKWSGRRASRWLRLAEGTSKAPRRALVSDADGSVLASLDMDREGERAFGGRGGHRLVLSSRQGSVSVVEATCAHQHCLRQGRVSFSGERLVCAPAGLVVTLEA